MQEEDEGDQLEVPGEAVEEAPQCPDPSSIHSKAEVKRLSARLQLVERELMNMRSKSQRLAKRLRRSQAMASARVSWDCWKFRNIPLSVKIMLIILSLFDDQRQETPAATRKEMGMERMR